MMLSELFKNSDNFFNGLNEVSQRPQIHDDDGTTDAFSTASQKKNRGPLLEVQQDEEGTSPNCPNWIGTSNQFHRIPCKARGMSARHNSDTAFLDIPVDAPHGLLLSCSHPECAEAGRSFRYCIVCANPVAQRNFPKRHGHGLIKSAKDLKVIDYKMCRFIASTTRSVLAAPEDGDATPPICQPAAVNNTPTTTTTTSTDVLPISSLAKNKVPLRRSVSWCDAATQKEANKNAPVAKSFLDLSANEQQWLNLLRDRPEHDTMLSTWMDNVIRVSEDTRSATGVPLPHPRNTMLLRDEAHSDSTLGVPQAHSGTTPQASDAHSGTTPQASDAHSGSQAPHQETKDTIAAVPGSNNEHISMDPTYDSIPGGQSMIFSGSFELNIFAETNPDQIALQAPPPGLSTSAAALDGVEVSKCFE